MIKKNKIAVVYRSKTGYTKEYATWLSQDLQCDLLEENKIKISDLLKFDTIIYGGGVYASTINGVGLITKNYSQLEGKNIIIFAVGSSPVKEETIKQLQERNIPAMHRDKIKFFYLRGGFDINKLTGFNKFIMNIFIKKMNSDKKAAQNQNNQEESLDHPQNYTDRVFLKPIIESAGVA